MEHDTSYRIRHQAPGPDLGECTTVRMDQLGTEADQTMPRDVLKHPKRYYARYRSCIQQLRRASGNPEQLVQVWRAVPRGVVHINPGDWVAISPEYAAGEARRGDHVITTRVRADQLWCEGLLEEWGFQGPQPVSAKRDVEALAQLASAPMTAGLSTESTANSRSTTI